MRKLLSKQQIQVIMLLNAALIIMFVGVLFSTDFTPSGADAVTPPPPHSIIRSARVSANSDISWETNIGGSGDEQVIATYTLYNRIFIFGNTTSSDYDFAGAKGVGFAAVLMPSGNTKSFTVFPFSIARVLPTLSGFAVAGNEGNTGVLKILNSDCTVTGSATLNPGLKLTVLDLYIYDTTYLLVSSLYDEGAEAHRLYVSAFKSDLSLKFERKFHREYDMSYITILPYQKGFILAANIIAPKANYLTLAVFDAKSEAAYKDIITKFDYFAYNVVPYDNGYAALINKGGIPQLITIADFKYDLTKQLDSDSADGAQLFYSGDYYYCFVKPTASSGVLLQLGHGLSGNTPVAQGSDFFNLFDYNQNDKAAFILGSTDSHLKLLGLSADNSVMEKSFATEQEYGAQLLPLEDGILVIASSTKKSADVGGNFGGSDIWICKVPFNTL